MLETLERPSLRLNPIEKRKLAQDTQDTITSLDEAINAYVRIIVGNNEFEAAQTYIAAHANEILEGSLLDNESIRPFIDAVQAVWQRLSNLYAEAINIQHPIEISTNSHCIKIRCYDTLDDSFLAFFSPQPPGGMSYEESVLDFSGKRLTLNNSVVKTKKQQAEIEALLRPIKPIIGCLKEEANRYWGEELSSPAPEYEERASGIGRRILAILRHPLRRYR